MHGISFLFPASVYGSFKTKEKSIWNGGIFCIRSVKWASSRKREAPVRDGPLEKWRGGGGIFSWHECFFFCSLLVQEFFFRLNPLHEFFSDKYSFFLSEISIHYLFFA